MKYHLLGAALMLAAFVLFVSGISLAGTSFVGALLIAAAVACEFRFWQRVVHRRHGAASQ